MGQDDSPPNGKRSDHGGQGPISRAELETRNTERSEKASRKIEFKIDIGEINVGEIKTDGGVEVSDLAGDVGEKLDGLLFKAIILLVLVFFTIVAWRIGSIIRLLELVFA